MKRPARIAKTVIGALTHITGWAAALSLVAAAFIVTEAVVVRKIFGVSTIWQTEASVFLLIYVVFTGAPFVQKNEHHLNVDLLIIHLSPRARELTMILVSIVSCVLAGVVGFYAWPMWWETVTQHQHSMSLWGPPLWIPYLFLPLGMTVLFLQYILYICEKINAFRKGEIETEKERFELRDIELKEAARDQ